MTAYYNEHDEFAASWLRNLINAGLIANGEVDTRSIVDVRPGDLAGFAQCHFFAGIGGWSYALRRAGWDDSAPVWTGSCPCQPFSLAGAQRGFDDERHLWPTWRELIRQCGPAIVFGEQVASATDWLGLVRGDLETMGYAVGAVPIQAASAGADHLRDRYWFVADANDAGSQGRRVLPERAGERIAGPNGLAHASRDDEQWDRESSEGGQPQVSPRGLRATRDVGIADCRGRTPRQQAASSARHGRPAVSAGRGDDMADSEEQRRQIGDAGSVSGSAIGERPAQQSERCGGDAEPGFEWVIGADGKARRVKPGIRLLAHGVPNRVGLLRGFGNAIDHRPAKEFIQAYMTARRGLAMTSQERQA